MLCLLGGQVYSMFVCVRGVSNLYTTLAEPHPLCQTPLWAHSASRMTVSMWQSSLKWKGSRMLGLCANFASLGFHPFHRVCQWLGLWMKAFETMPTSTVSDQWASAMVRRCLRWFGAYLRESRQLSWSCGWKKVLRGVQSFQPAVGGSDEERKGEVEI